jgi:TRAP-type C4-dicarboxylate transport system permease small subunit
MSVRNLGRIAVAYSVIGAIALTWPGMLPFSRSVPRVLGLPFSVFWVAAWAGLGFIVLFVLERAITRAENASAGDADAADANAGEAPWNAGS